MKKLNIHNIRLTFLLIMLMAMASVIGIVIAVYASKYTLKSYSKDESGNVTVAVAKEALGDINNNAIVRLRNIQKEIENSKLPSLLPQMGSSGESTLQIEAEIGNELNVINHSLKNQFGPIVDDKVIITNQNGRGVGLSVGETYSSSGLPSYSSTQNKTYAYADYTHEQWWQDARVNEINIGVNNDGQNDKYIPFSLIIKNSTGGTVGVLKSDILIQYLLMDLSVEPSMSTSGAVNYYPWTKEITKGNIASIFVIDKNGNIQYTSEEGEQLSNADRSDLLKIASLNESGNLSGYFNGAKQNNNENEELKGYAFVDTDNQPNILPWGVVAERDTAPIIRQNTLIVLPFVLSLLLDAIMMASLLWVLLRRLIMNPINKLNKEISLMKDGHYNLNIKPSGNNEVGKLIESVSLMSSRIDEDIDKITGLNGRLEVINQTIRHDLNNRLIYIIYTVNELQKSAGDNGDMKQRLREVADAAESSISFLQSMQVVENDAVNFKKLKVMQLSQVINRVIRDNQDMQIEMKGEAVVLADEAVYSIVNNLVHNAKVHAKVNLVSIIVEEGKDDVILRVIDRGQGISDEVKKNLFNKGFIHGSTGHTGIGLYVVKETMRRYGGKVWVEDNQPTGSVFVLSFPKNERLLECTTDGAITECHYDRGE